MTRTASKRGPYTQRTGLVYGRLTVIGPSGTSHKRYCEWVCECSCGNQVVVSSRSLDGKRLKSCGCLARERRHPGGDIAAFNRVWVHYTKAAEARGYAWELTKEDFRELTSTVCFYCGTLPSKSPKLKKGSTSLPYVYNGVDRVDNSKGYIAGNCVPCCHQCNWAKVDKTIDEFYTWLERVYCYGRGIEP